MTVEQKMYFAKFFKQILWFQCPYCHKNIDTHSSILDNTAKLVIGIFSFVFRQKKWCDDDIIYCSKCHKKLITNENRFLELLVSPMILLGLFSISFGIPLVLVNYKYLYTFIVVALLIYFRCTRKIHQAQ